MSIGMVINLDGKAATADGMRELLDLAREREVVRIMLNVDRKLHWPPAQRTPDHKGITLQHPDACMSAMVQHVLTEWVNPLTLYTGNVIGNARVAETDPGADLSEPNDQWILAWKAVGVTRIYIDWLGGRHIDDNQIGPMGLKPSWAGYDRRTLYNRWREAGKDRGIVIGCEPCTQDGRPEICLTRYMLDQTGGGEFPPSNQRDLWSRADERDPNAPFTADELRALDRKFRTIWLGANDRRWEEM